ncbi:tRNA/rRNA methyltransferase/tRNA (cytidine32/uridine32-2'-O)-methyltransferase [Natronocella acetinitrilica]|uniref:tRNA (cytidine/uridine-2'-O-)-methyltransferase TrmJ n=1 Tax=Natronocella acetinitrilica TaxID=414046 RepID=A0AAE3G9N4_9GAMM|nr:RNA methyltransferase [Natronocella acetinitrilica]MCP1676347.1 tRNA/rRNA methyltransferase/tRNA (cytidine32/uridine32-2'-O)-methyltransferase [Natronocella acetinitrilica]
MLPDNVRIVLVEPQLAANIGSAARAMKTMGLSELHLVAPRQWPHPDAAARASGADDLLAGAVVHESLIDAIAGAGLVVGLTARSRTLSAPQHAPRPGAAVIARESLQHPVAVLFGRERTGLTNEEVDLCHRLIHIPSVQGFSSLNLAAAVQVMAYELRLTMVDEDSVPQPACEWPPATADDMERLYDHLERALIRLEFLNPDNPRALMRRLRLLLGRARPDHNEYQILRGILAHVELALDGELPHQKRAK